MKYYTKKCLKCSKEYQGTASAKYCIDCKDILRVERARANSKKQRAKRV